MGRGEEKPRVRWTEISFLFYLSLKRNIGMNPTPVVCLYPYDEISNFDHSSTNYKPDTLWITMNTPIIASLTVSELVWVIALTYWVKRTHRVDPGRKFIFSLYQKSYSIVKMCTWGLKFIQSIYTEWTIYRFCQLHQSL